jgi:hypothetical protein
MLSIVIGDVCVLPNSLHKLPDKWYTVTSLIIIVRNKGTRSQCYFFNIKHLARGKAGIKQ